MPGTLFACMVLCLFIHSLNTYLCWFFFFFPKPNMRLHSLTTSHFSLESRTCPRGLGSPVSQLQGSLPLPPHQALCPSLFPFPHLQNKALPKPLALLHPLLPPPLLPLIPKRERARAGRESLVQGTAMWRKREERLDRKPQEAAASEKVWAG